VLGRILDGLEVIQRDMPVIFPVHPRTRKAFADSPLGRRAASMPDLRLIDPLGFLDFLKLMSDARVVLTDSGGIQEETTILGVPCLTLRENTERPVTVDVGSNRIVGTDTSRILESYRAVMSTHVSRCGTPPLWDGRAAERIVEIMQRELDPGTRTA
jgi:UDP-N-acetylglucosamine 2-epimerase (non-hydrolysing)